MSCEEKDHDWARRDMYLWDKWEFVSRRGERETRRCPSCQNLVSRSGPFWRMEVGELKSYLAVSGWVLTAGHADRVNWAAIELPSGDVVRVEDPDMDYSTLISMCVHLAAKHSAAVCGVLGTN